jgi:hypothetical protein
VDAIYAEEDVPENLSVYAEINRMYFADKGAARQKVEEVKPRG